MCCMNEFHVALSHTLKNWLRIQAESDRLLVQCNICAAFCPLAYLTYNETIQVQPPPQQQHQSQSNSNYNYNYNRSQSQSQPQSQYRPDKLSTTTKQRLCCFRHLDLFAPGPKRNGALQNVAVEVQVPLQDLRWLKAAVASKTKQPINPSSD